MEIKEAYSILIDRSQRLRYDAMQSNMYLNTEDGIEVKHRFSSSSSSSVNSGGISSSNEDNSGNERKRCKSQNVRTNCHSSDGNSSSSGTEEQRGCEHFDDCYGDNDTDNSGEAKRRVSNNNNTNNTSSADTAATTTRRRRRARRAKEGSSSTAATTTTEAAQSIGSTATAVPLRPEKADVEVEVSMTLDEVYNGCTKHVDYEKYDVCPECNGLGCLRFVSCFECKGSGCIDCKRCTLCKGLGKLGLTQEKCPACGGGGCAKHVVRGFCVKVPAGVCADSVLPFPGEGNYIPLAQGHGTLLVRVREVPHPVFKRNGADLSTEVRLSLRDALCGYSLNISHLNGKSFCVKSPHGKITRPNDCVVVKGLGLPVLGTPQGSAFGNLVIRLVVDFPPDNFFPQKSIDLLNQILV